MEDYNKESDNKKDWFTYSLKIVTYVAFLIMIIYLIFSEGQTEQTELDMKQQKIARIIKTHMISDDYYPWDKSIYVLKQIAKNPKAIGKFPYLQKTIAMWENNARNQKCISKDFKRHRAKVAIANSKDKKHIRFAQHPEKSFFLNMKCTKGPYGYTWTKVI